MTVLCLVSLCSVSIGAPAQAQEPNGEYRLKAAFLYNFAKFVEWPAASFSDNHTPFVICTVGHSSLDPELDQLAGKVVRDRPLVPKHIRTDDHLTDCHLLYVSPNELKHTPEILRTLQKAPVLTTCDSEDCADAGFMFNMRVIDNRIALDLNLEAVQRTQLKVSSQLIKLTRIVKGQP